MSGILDSLEMHCNVEASGRNDKSELGTFLFKSIIVIS